MRLLPLLPVALAAAWWVARTPERSVESLVPRWGSGASSWLAIDGLRVHLRDEGPVDDPLPLALLHGSGTSLHTWDGWVSRLPHRRVIRFDRPGFGLTGPHPAHRYGMDDSAAFLGKVLDALGVKRCVLVGNSSGGRVAWHTAAVAPERVSRLVLIGSAGYPRTTPLPPGLRLMMHPAGPLVSSVLPRGASDDEVRRMYGDPAKVGPEVLDRHYELALRAGNRAALGRTLRQAHATDETARIRTIVAPTLLVWGEQDTVVPPADARKFQADLPVSQLLLLPGVGHLVQEEAPAETIAALEDFLDGTGAG